MRFTLSNIQQVNLPGIRTVYFKPGVALWAKLLAGFKMKTRCISKRGGQVQAFYRITYQFLQQINYLEPGVFFSMP